MLAPLPFRSDTENGISLLLAEEIGLATSTINSFGLAARLPLLASLCLALAACSTPRTPVVWIQIEKEKTTLPDGIAVESLSVSGDFLRAPWIIELLSDRNLKMLEIQPARSGYDPQLAALTYGESTWHMPVALFKFVQLRLAPKGDPSCLDDAKLPSELSRAIERPPVVADTCLAMMISPVSTATHSIRLRERDGDMRFNRWELVEAAGNKVLASLSTDNTSVTRGPGTELRLFDSRAPHTALLALANRSDASGPPSDRFYMKRIVVASAHPDPQLSGKSGADVPVSTRRLFYTKPKTGFLSSEDWPKAVTEARTTGWGDHHGDLLEQASGVRWNLDLSIAPEVPGSHIERPQFHVEAGDRGFYVRPDIFDPAKRHWLSRYDAQGKLLWQVFVVRTGYRAEDNDCSGKFELARATPQEIVFQRNCYGAGDVAGLQRVEELFIKKRDIAVQLGRTKLN
ncbi:hypothetical protein [Massilia sp. CCM 8734]|uniref:hypothetical protein n=1 Tax=Massilia sp. CCM 8734 TaxID=2609283 RepID=UPI0014205776|nr:hypothetical protein [Massilia sp. CCM 8734]NHZ96546.1 hypothetical protein [Massilia sp. CCM 8734]